MNEVVKQIGGWWLNVSFGWVGFGIRINRQVKAGVLCIGFVMVALTKRRRPAEDLFL